MKQRLFKSFAVAAVTAGFLATSVVPVGANHSWGDYHWARQGNPFAVQLGSNVSRAWSPYLNTTSADWSASDVLDTPVVAGGTSPKACRPTNGRVEVCTAAYGRTGWLGLAQIWASGSHITQGVAKMNDTYFNTATYDTPAWRNLVMCQEVGHTLGLGHNDEDFNTTNNTCMDYSYDPEPNQHPNAHDYEQLEAIYAHLDSTTTVSLSSSNSRGASAEVGDGNDPSEWGRAIRFDAKGRPILYERDLGGDRRLFTFVYWTPDAPGHGQGRESHTH